MTTTFQLMRAQPALRSGMGVTQVIDVLLVPLVTFVLSHAARRMTPLRVPVQATTPVAPPSPGTPA